MIVDNFDLTDGDGDRIIVAWDPTRRVFVIEAGDQDDLDSEVHLTVQDGRDLVEWIQMALRRR